MTLPVAVGLPVPLSSAAPAVPVPFSCGPGSVQVVGRACVLCGFITKTFPTGTGQTVALYDGSDDTGTEVWMLGTPDNSDFVVAWPSTGVLCNSGLAAYSTSATFSGIAYVVTL